MIIRKAKLNDLNILTELLIEFKKELNKFLPKSMNIFRKQEKSITQIRNSIKKELQNKKGLFLVAEDKEIVGFAYGTVQEYNHMIFKTVKYGKIGHLWITKDFRKKGIASKLKKELFKYFKKNNCKYVELLVLDKNPAKKIYKKWGFALILDTMKKLI